MGFVCARRAVLAGALEYGVSIPVTNYRRHRKECEGNHPEDSRSGEFEEGRRGWRRRAYLMHMFGTVPETSEIASIIMSGVLGLLMAFLAYGRMVLKPIS